MLVSFVIRPVLCPRHAPHVQEQQRRLTRKGPRANDDREAISRDGSSSRFEVPVEDDRGLKGYLISIGGGFKGDFCLRLSKNQLIKPDNIASYQVVLLPGSSATALTCVPGPEDASR